MKRVNHLLKDTRGLSTVEYIIILAFIAVAGIGLWKTFGGTVLGKLGESNRKAVDISTEEPSAGGNGQ